MQQRAENYGNNNFYILNKVKEDTILEQGTHKR